LNSQIQEEDAVFE